MELVIDLKQHTGLACRPIVKVGDSVERGELIAVPEGLGANIHAGVSGRVSNINRSIHILKSEEQPEGFVKIPETSSHLEAIREAGVVGAGGAGFPTHVKLSTKIPGGTLVVNCAECEPLFAHNIARIEKDPEQVIRGARYLMDIVQAERVCIAIKPKHERAMFLLKKLCEGHEKIQVRELPDLYPAGDERVILRELFGILMAPGDLPSKYNAVIVNVETLKNCVLAIEERRPVISKDFTIAGKLKGESKVFLDEPIGMPVSHYICERGGVLQGSGEIVIGGPFTGKRGNCDSAFLSKTSGGILVALEFPKDTSKFGILACECGADEARLREIVESMGGSTVAIERCKRMLEVNGRFRCERPGDCPGQAETVLKLKKQGAEALLVGSCED